MRGVAWRSHLLWRGQGNGAVPAPRINGRYAKKKERVIMPVSTDNRSIFSLVFSPMNSISGAAARGGCSRPNIPLGVDFKLGKVRVPIEIDEGFSSCARHGVGARQGTYSSAAGPWLRQNDPFARSRLGCSPSAGAEFRRSIGLCVVFGPTSSIPAGAPVLRGRPETPGAVSLVADDHNRLSVPCRFDRLVAKFGTADNEPPAAFFRLRRSTSGAGSASSADLLARCIPRIEPRSLSGPFTSLAMAQGQCSTTSGSIFLVIRRGRPRSWNTGWKCAFRELVRRSRGRLS